MFFEFKMNKLGQILKINYNEDIKTVILLQISGYLHIHSMNKDNIIVKSRRGRRDRHFPT